MFAIFSGQPLLILSFTLPLTLFEGLLSKVCEQYDLDFLPFRLWIGIWTMFFLLVFVALGVSNCVQYFTRFTLEIFAVLSPLVLMGYGFVYLCEVVKDYSDMQGMFLNRSCQCIQYINNITLVNGTNITITMSKVMEVHFHEC